MKERKTEFHYFTLMDYEKEQEYLRKMHRAGWKLTSVRLPGFYQFEKCEAEDVIYQLDYHQEGVKNKEEYVQLFQDCGWEYLMDFVGYSYFRKPAVGMKEDEGIFCDDSSRLEMMKRVFRGRLLPLLFIFFVVIIPQLFLNASLEGEKEIFFVIFGVLFLVYIAIFISFVVKYRAFKKRL